MSDPAISSPSTETAKRNYPKLLARYQRLLELTSDLTATIDLDTLLERIVIAAQELTDSEAASLLLYDPQSHSLYFEAATGPLVEGVGQTAVPAEHSIAGWIFTHNEPLLSDDVLSDPRFFREIDVLTRFKTRSIIGVPLQTKKKTLGVIESVNKISGKFNQEDVQILQTLAAQAAILIENSQLFKQSDLVAEIVHELRTPLTSLTAAAHLLQRNELPEDQHQTLGRTILTEVRRLNDMASDFLELSRLESGRARLAREPVHLGGLVQECFELIKPQAEEKNISLSTAIDVSVTPVHGDRNLLKQLLLNLLTNAIKYNVVDGTIKVVVRAEDDLVTLEVIDSGCGISNEDQKHLFERFYRVPAQRDVAGTGLGLAIAKKIAESHQGTISVQSELGKGSTFSVQLPSGPPPTMTSRARS
jgi:signal transduction histidine kinase